MKIFCEDFKPRSCYCFAKTHVLACRVHLTSHVCAPVWTASCRLGSTLHLRMCASCKILRRGWKYFARTQSPGLVIVLQRLVCSLRVYISPVICVRLYERHRVLWILHFIWGCVCLVNFSDEDEDMLRGLEAQVLLLFCTDSCTRLACTSRQLDVCVYMNGPLHSYCIYTVSTSCYCSHTLEYAHTFRIWTYSILYAFIGSDS